MSYNFFQHVEKEKLPQVPKVILDGSQGSCSGVPAVWAGASPRLAIVRLHRRNVETWERKGLTASSDRFNYEYGDDELKEIAERIKTLSRHMPVVQPAVQ